METLLSGDANDEARASSSAATPQAEPGASASDTALVKALEVVGPVTPDGESTFHTDSLPSHHPSAPGSGDRVPKDDADYVAGTRPACVRDLAERLRALEEQVRLRDAALNATTTHFMISCLGPAGSEIVYANRAASDDHGYSREELLGRSPTMLVPPDLNPGAMRTIRDALEQGTSIRLQIHARRKDGSTFICGLTITPIRDPIGNKHYAVAVGANITAAIAEREAKKHLQEQLVAELKERERIGMELRLAQKLESVGRLAAGIAHEINTPIQFVGDSLYFLKSTVADLQQLVEVYRASLEAVSRGEDPEAVKSRLREVEASFNKEFLATEIPAAFSRTHEGIERVAAIVRAMKEFAHPDAKEHSPADLNHAIETTLLVARNEYKYCATVEAELAELPPVVCNVGELNQVFLNLIVNAAHAIEAGGRDVSEGRIRIRTARAGEWARIEIEDNGCGIPNENLDRIFDPFFTTKEVGKGTGQGLAIARSIVVEKHGGRIDVESVVGRGTRMIVDLPIGGRGAGVRS